MGVINGLNTVNCGEIIWLDAQDPVNKKLRLGVEVLRPEKHNPNAEIMCYYFWDSALNKGVGAKIELSIYRVLDKNKWGAEVRYFTNAKDLHPYRSVVYSEFIRMPGKYYELVKYLHKYFRMIYKIN